MSHKEIPELCEFCKRIPVVKQMVLSDWWGVYCEIHGRIVWTELRGTKNAAIRAWNKNHK